MLELNMHCLLRPMYILHTRDSVPQDNDLDLYDFAAAHAVMASLGRRVPRWPFTIAVLRLELLRATSI